MNQAQDQSTFRFRDPGLPVEERVNDLLCRMALEEKVAQLGSYWIGAVLAGEGERAQFDREKAGKLLVRGIGQITRPAGRWQRAGRARPRRGSAGRSVPPPVLRRGLCELTPISG